ncbi:MAG: hypothetical protein NC079_01475 [Clostridium sp.]|nr:hypothetical protein [Acetatifactor muris]MCM1525981.1 hypothetical protein [Bacteroides sp.]MCM1562259.1 hypothetical protein [Clostridium sp.]
MTSAKSMNETNANGMGVNAPDGNAADVAKTAPLSLWSLMKENLRRRRGMALLCLLGSLLASPVAFLLYLDQVTGCPPEYMVDVSQSLLNYLSNSHLTAQMIVLYLSAFLLGMEGFKHLFSRGTADLWHSAPVTRNRLFGVLYGNGFLIWFIPFACGHLFVSVMTLLHMDSPALRHDALLLLLIEFVLIVLSFLMIYHVCLVAVMFSGNGKNAVSNALILGLGACFVYITFHNYTENYLRTFYVGGSMVPAAPFLGLSPLAAPIDLYVCLTMDWGTAHFSLAPHAGTIALCVLVAIANLLLAIHLHAKRPTELAERGVDDRHIRIPLRLGTSVLAGPAVAMLFRISVEDSGSIWPWFGAILGSVLAFVLLNILYHASPGAAFAHKGQMAAAVILSCAVVFLFSQGLFGYDSRLPEAEDILSISIHSSAFPGAGYGLRQNERTGGYYYEKNSDFDLAANPAFTDAEANHRLLSTLVAMSRDDYHPFTQDADTPVYFIRIAVHVNTAQGSSYEREYDFYMDDAGREALKPFTDSAAFREFYAPMASGLTEPCGILACPPSSLSASAYPVHMDDPERIAALQTAYAQDFAEHYDPVGSHFDQQNHIYLQYEHTQYSEDPGDPSDSYLTGRLSVPEYYERTIALLSEWYPDMPWMEPNLAP